MSTALAVETTTMAPRPTVEALQQRVDRLELQRDDDAQQVRRDLDDLTRRLVTGPVEGDRIRFTPRVVTAIVGCVLSVVLGMYGATYGLRSDVRNILTTMEQQEKVEVEKEKLAVEKQKLADERLMQLRNAVDMVDKRQQLQAIETQELKEMVLKQGAAK